MKYLVVDMTRVMRESEHGKVALESLTKLVDRARAQEDTLRAKFDKAAGSAAKKQAQRAFYDFQLKAKKELDRRREALERALVAIATSAARAVAEEHGVELVLERGAVLFYDEASDVTEEVIRKVNEAKIGAKKASST